MTSITATQTPTQTVIAAKRRYLEVVKSRFTAADVERIVPHLEASIADLEANPLPTHYVVQDGDTGRVSAQTASRDYTVALVAGEYPLTAHVNPEGSLAYLSAAVDAVAPTRSESSAEWGGVAIASRTVQGGAETYHLRVDAYRLKTVDGQQDDLGGRLAWH